MEKILSLAIILGLGCIVQSQLIPQSGITVAQDGSGNFTTISDAVDAAPTYSKQTYYIQIKAGTYAEYIIVGVKKTNIAFIGDGIGATIITGNKSNGTHYSTYDSATVAIDGNGFIAKYITFRNSAGPSNGQAVAMRSSFSLSAFYKCRFEGYQDILYVHRGVQFYRECEIFGTIDIIFGNAKVVFQNCSIFVHNPGQRHSNVITAQGRGTSDQITGISIHNCKIMPAKDFNSNLGIKTYLGRPWRKFSTVVIMKSFLSSIIDPEGWLKWNNDTSALSSLYYGEYHNKGPGSITVKRVRWEGVHKAMNIVEAENFTVRNFINGEAWIHPTGIPFSLDL
ncbi:unnamed protein product [Ilex paraguariensis]|uniref:Pectinesterase n=1 Tax=Ilex paraguariensis TaxID=185542 RepID=A0ABC8RLK3_9AQUA